MIREDGKPRRSAPHQVDLHAVPVSAAKVKEEEKCIDMANQSRALTEKA
jgi:hypothetical protein